MRRLFLFIVLGLFFTPYVRAGDDPKKDLLGDPLPAGVATRLGTVRLRHAGPITVTAWAPNGKLLASGGMDELIRLWDPATGKAVRQMKGAGGSTALVFFNDGKTLVSADLQGYIRLWDVESGREFRRFGSTKDRVTCLALSPDNRTLFSAGSERIVRQWLVAVGLELRQFPVHQGNILALAVTADGKELRTAADDGLALVFDTATGVETRRFALESKRGPIPLTATFSKGGQMLACTRADGALSLYEADSGKLLRTAGGPIMRPNALDFSPNGKFLAAALFTGGVRVFGVASGQEMRAFDNPTFGRGAVAFAPDGQTLVAAAGDQALRLWHVGDNREILPLPGHVSAVEFLCFSRDGTLLFSATRNDRAIRVWDRATGKEIAQFEHKLGFMRAVSAGTGPRSFLTIGFESASEWSVNDKKEITQVRKWDPLKSLTGMAASPDGKMVAVAGADPAISILDAASGKLLIKLAESKEGAPDRLAFRTTSLIFSPDGRLLAANTTQAPIQVWNVATGRLVRQFGPGKGLAVKLAFSPDSKLLAAGDQEIRLYEIASGQERLQVPQTIGIRALAFSPDGRYVVANLYKSGIQFYEVATGFPAGQHGDAAGEVRALAISPDGVSLASAVTDTSVVLWAKPLWREPRPIAPFRLEPDEVEILWKTLAQPDGLRAHQAIWALAGAPAQSVPFLRGKIKPADAVQPVQVEQYIRDLDSSVFETRQKALRELQVLGDQVEIPLRAALNKSRSLESRRRMEQILSHFKELSPEKLQSLRALEVLEYAGTEEALLVLAVVAKGGAGHWLTDHARQALQRLHRAKAGL